jgi:hypothetical protein
LQIITCENKLDGLYVIATELSVNEIKLQKETNVVQQNNSKLQQGVQQLAMQISRLRTENEKYVANYYELVNEK